MKQYKKRSYPTNRDNINQKEHRRAQKSTGEGGKKSLTEDNQL